MAAPTALAGAVSLATLVAMAATPGRCRAAQGQSREEPPREQRIDVQVRGPLAVVEVLRPLTFGAEALRAAADEVVVDLDLPEGARLEAVEVGRDGQEEAVAGDQRRRPARVRLKLDPPAAGAAGAATAAAEALKGYGAAMDAGGWSRARVPLDEGADFRLRVAAPGLGQGAAASRWTLRYRFVAPLECRAGEMVLGMPGSLDPAPAPARVEVRVQAGPGAPPMRLSRVGPVASGGGTNGGRVLGPVITGPSLPRRRPPIPTGSPWEIALRLGAGQPQKAAQRPTLFALSASGRVDGGEGVLVTTLCRPPVGEAALRPPATRMLLVMDRSRSMGPGGAASARDLARGLALALPPSLSFNGLVFDRTSEPLFPLARSATLEALRALDDALGMGALRNGTALGPALRRAGQLHAGDPQLRQAPAYLVIITDGALADEDRGPALAEAVRSLPAAGLQTAMLVLRQEEDQRAAAGDRRALATVPARTGGILRELGPRAVGEAAPALVAALRAGGDLLDPRLIAPRLPSPAEFDQSAVAPGGGTRLMTRTPRPVTGVRLRGSYGGRTIELGSAPVALGRGEARALLAGPAAPRLATTQQGAALLLPVNGEDPGSPRAARGQMDRDVVHKQLAYAYLPRARACYLTRAVKTARDFQLRGRLRLELHLERGEMVAAVIKRSTLGRPDIEACLREAAFAVEIPRALANDAPVLAALNLVLRPRTAPRNPDAGAEGTPLAGELGQQMGQQIDRIIGPLGPASDPLELLVE